MVRPIERGAGTSKAGLLVELAARFIKLRMRLILFAGGPESEGKARVGVDCSSAEIGHDLFVIIVIVLVPFVLLHIFVPTFSRAFLFGFIAVSITTSVST
jgi:hypothetical protein